MKEYHFVFFVCVLFLLFLLYFGPTTHLYSIRRRHCDDDDDGDGDRQ